jgi:hypothetical protein
MSTEAIIPVTLGFKSCPDNDNNGVLLIIVLLVGTAA